MLDFVHILYLIVKVTICPNGFSFFSSSFVSSPYIEKHITHLYYPLLLCVSIQKDLDSQEDIQHCRITLIFYFEIGSDDNIFLAYQRKTFQPPQCIFLNLQFLSMQRRYGNNFDLYAEDRKIQKLIK